MLCIMQHFTLQSMSCTNHKFPITYVTHNVCVNTPEKSTVASIYLPSSIPSPASLPFEHHSLEVYGLHDGVS